METETANKYEQMVLVARGVITEADRVLCDSLAQIDADLPLYEDLIQQMRFIGGASIKETRATLSGKSELLMKRGALLKLLGLTHNTNKQAPQRANGLDDL